MNVPLAAIDQLLGRPDVPPRVAASVATLAVLGPPPPHDLETGQPQSAEEPGTTALRGAAYHAIVDWLTESRKEHRNNGKG